MKAKSEVSRLWMFVYHWMYLELKEYKTADAVVTCKKFDSLLCLSDQQSSRDDPKAVWCQMEDLEKADSKQDPETATTSYYCM